MHRFNIAAALLITLLVGAVVASAQEFPRAEVALGYSLVRFSTTGVLEQFTAQGGSTNIALNFNRKIGIVADFGGYNNNNVRGFNVDNTTFTYLFGPRFTARGDKVSLFGNALFGGAHISGSASGCFGPGTCTTVAREESNNSAAFLIGGGLDISAGKHFAVRPAQFDYLLIRFNPTIAGVERSETQNNLRYSAMVVFKF
jgi:hypothetical protein